MKSRLFAFAAVSAFALAIAGQAAQAAPATTPVTPGKPAAAPAATPPTLPTSPEDATAPTAVAPAAPAVPASPATKAIPPAPTDTPPASDKAPAPAFRAGAKVSDSTGAPIGVIQSVAEASTGSMVVLNVDGKLVSVPQGTLSPFGETVKSSQTKAQILSAAPK